MTWGAPFDLKKRSASERETDDSAHKVITTVTMAGPDDAPSPNPDPPTFDEPANNQTTTIELPQVLNSGVSEP